MRREPITTPFLAKDTDAQFDESVLLFQLVLRFMNDSSLRTDQEELIANYIASQVRVLLVYKWGKVLKAIAPLNNGLSRINAPPKISVEGRAPKVVE